MTRAQLEKRIRKLHRSGMGMMKIGKALGVGTTVVRRAIYRASWPKDAKGNRISSAEFAKMRTDYLDAREEEQSSLFEASASL